MEKIENVEKYLAYQLLVLKRDLNRLVLDIRSFRQIMEKNAPIHIRNKSLYCEYMLKHGDFQKRIRKLLDKAALIGMNPNGLSLNDNIWSQNLSKVYEATTPSEREKIDRLKEEIEMLRSIISSNIVKETDEPRFLSTELIYLYGCSYSPLSKDQIGEILKTLFYGAEHKLNSTEYSFLLGSEEKKPWLDSCFKSYFIDRELPLEERQVDFERIFDAGYLEQNERVFESFKKYLEFYLTRGCKLTELQFTSFIEDEKFGVAEINALANHKGALPFSVLEYIDRLLGEKMGETRLEHDIDSPFYKVALETEDDVKSFGISLATVLPKIMCLKDDGLSNGDIVAHLANRLVALDNAHDIANIISNDLYTKSALAEAENRLEDYAYYELLSETFDKAFLNAMAQISREEDKKMHMTPVEENK